MQKRFYTFPFSRIPKLEFPKFINRMIAISEKYPLELLHINGMFAKLKSLQPSLKKLKVVDKKGSMTNDLKVLNAKSIKLIKGIVSHIKGANMAQVDSMAGHIALVKPFVEKYLAKVLSESPKARAERISQMCEELNDDAELQASVSAVGLQLYMDELSAIQQSTEAAQTKNLLAKAKRVKMKTKEVKSEISQAMFTYLKSIELAMLEYPELDYAPLVNELNALLLVYQTDYKARKTRLKTEEEKDADEKADEETDAGSTKDASGTNAA